MKTTALKTVKTVDPTTIPDGIYSGEWSSDFVKFRVGESDYTTYTQIRIRGMNTPCTVTANGGNLEIEIEFPATYGQLMRPLVICELSAETQQLYREDATFREWVHLCDKVMRAEKISSWTQWTPEQSSAYAVGDYALFSRLRGYTEQEIQDFERHLDLIKTLDQSNGDEFCLQFIHEIQETVRTPEFDDVETRILAMHRAGLRQEATNRLCDL